MESHARDNGISGVVVKRDNRAQCKSTNDKRQTKTECLSLVNCFKKQKAKKTSKLEVVNACSREAMSSEMMCIGCCACWCWRWRFAFSLVCFLFTGLFFTGLWFVSELSSHEKSKLKSTAKNAFHMNMNFGRDRKWILTEFLI